MGTVATARNGYRLTSDAFLEPGSVRAASGQNADATFEVTLIAPGPDGAGPSKKAMEMWALGTVDLQRSTATF